MSDKPSYLGMLNAIAIGEARAHAYFSAWAETTTNEDVRGVLRTVAAREGEHGMSFAKRINELGYHVRDKDDPGFEKAMAIVTSECSDLEKIEALKLHELDSGDRPDVFDGLFADHSIDIRTGEMLGRYIAEERDTARLVRSCYEQLCAAAGSAPAVPSTEALSAIEDKVDALCRAVDELRQIVCAQAMPAATS
jgi:rubrerythrin